MEGNHLNLALPLSQISFLVKLAQTVLVWRREGRVVRLFADSEEIGGHIGPRKKVKRQDL